MYLSSLRQGLSDTAFKIVPFLSSDNSDMAPPDPIPNSEVKRVSADGSVGVPM